MLKRSLNIIIALLLTSSVFSQSTTEELYNNFSSHNFLKHTRFFLNPTFSIARETTTSLSFLSRNKFSEYDDSPQLYVGSYSGKVNENVGLGFGVFQQNFGVFKNFGVLVNYAYQVSLSEKNSLAFGFNFLYAKSGLDRTRVITVTPDPFLDSFEERPIINFQPAVNLSLGSFDLGIFLENLVDYDLKANDFITPFSEKTISGHLMYTKMFKSKIGLFEEGKLQLLNIVSKSGTLNSTYSGSLLLDLPKAGWIQATYDDFYGTALGFGINLSKRLSIGFVHEKGKNSLGVTNEIGMTYFFGKKADSKKEDLKNLFEQEEKKDTIKSEKPITDKIIDSYKKENDSLKKNLDKVNSRNSQLQNILEQKESKDTTKVISNKPLETKKINKSEPVYYVVANYFSSHQNAKLFTKTLQERDLNAQYFKHPTKKYYYVYLDKFSTLLEAKSAVTSNLDNSYQELMSIVRIKNADAQKKKKTATKISIKQPQQNQPKIRKLKAGNGIALGYYLVVNVFSSKSFSDRFVKKLEDQKLSPKIFISPKNNYRYIYLVKKNSKEEIINLYLSHLNGKYTKDKWIMHIE